MGFACLAQGSASIQIPTYATFSGYQDPEGAGTASGWVLNCQGWTSAQNRSLSLAASAHPVPSQHHSLSGTVTWVEQPRHDAGPTRPGYFKNSILGRASWLGFNSQDHSQASVPLTLEKVSATVCPLGFKEQSFGRQRGESRGSCTSWRPRPVVVPGGPRHPAPTQS